MNMVEMTFFNEETIELTSSIDSVLRDGRSLTVSFRWEKKCSREGHPVIQVRGGGADYIFRQEDDIWRLYHVRGDDPLTSE